MEESCGYLTDITASLGPPDTLTWGAKYFSYNETIGRDGGICFSFSRRGGDNSL